MLQLLTTFAAERSELRETLQAALAGDAEALAAWEAQRAEAIAALQEDSCWLFTPSRGERRDGLTLTLGYPSFLDDSALVGSEPGWWTVTLEAWQGGYEPTVVLKALDMADAVAQVERRFPLPAWWRTLDEHDAREVRPFRASEAPGRD